MFVVVGMGGRGVDDFQRQGDKVHARLAFLAVEAETLLLGGA